MNFYKKSSVGRYSEEEQMMLNAIERLIEQKNIPLDKIPECETLDDLIEVKQLLDNYTEDLPFVEDQETLMEDELSDTESEFFEQEIDEPEIESATLVADSIEEMDDEQFISENYNPFSDQIIERSYTQVQGNTADQNLEEEQLDLEDAKGSPLSDLPPNTKRKAAEQTANTILKGYAQVSPMFFKWFAKLPEDKIEQLAFNGELDMSIEVSKGLTFDDYMKQTNEQIDEIFEVDQDTLSDIREPLIELLLEQEMELTPAQRLIAAVITHLGQMFAVALKLRKQNNRILSYQKHLTYLMQGAKVAA
jgi:hypothetical protein